ncbi:cytochrome c biogenesis CcdA family protein [Clostridium sp. 'White wine YQ']|uniref:cytochrome c biogenesis CcdA family protein n=1 Tax=Clostridium sp. 'White wine YQ' TaxID=3027474 RepID=UPI002366B0A0|nr:cytochrome c biogenesis protein CcdA [Clostridium sp. 'White wine YQ']MDD7793308.1 cytochrome c biogenesis protein CcdA [Clostridium sp. 'White wine YQ']
MNNITFILAFSAGLLSFLSPCVLPLVPAYISYLTSSTIKEPNYISSKVSSFYNALGFVLGFSLIFIIMGASATSIGNILIRNSSIFRKIGGVIIIIFGFHTIGIIKIKFLYFEKRYLNINNISKKFGSVIMGMSFAFGWTPCIGPILSSILIYSGSESTLSKGILLLISYSIGLALPFLLTSMALDKFIKYKNKLFKLMPIITFISGLLLIVIGYLMFTNKFNILNKYSNFINF